MTPAGRGRAGDAATGCESPRSGTGSRAHLRPGGHGRRLRSIDVARGAAVAGMLVVNLQGSDAHAFPGTRHANWHGLTPADLVFPAFLVVAGASMAQSSRLGHRRLLRRSGVLVVLGLVVNGLFRVPFADLRLPGVLQRIGLASLLAGLLVLHASIRVQVTVAAAVLVGYWAALVLVPVPTHGAGDLSPEGNLAGWVDRTALGAAHLLGGGPTDPEGLLSTLPAAVTVLAGVWAGRQLRSSRRRTPEEEAAEQGAEGAGAEGAGAAGSVRRTVVARLASAGALAAVAGAAWHPWLPVNKRLWTGSFVLVTAGLTVVLLAGVHAVTGAGSPRRGRWLELLGRNAIAVYVLSGLVASTLEAVEIQPGAGHGAVPLRRHLYDEWFASWAGPTWGSFAHALAFLAFWWAVAALLDRRGWYVKV